MLKKHNKKRVDIISRHSVILQEKSDFAGITNKKTGFLIGFEITMQPDKLEFGGMNFIGARDFSPD